MFVKLDVATHLCVDVIVECVTKSFLSLKDVLDLNSFCVFFLDSDVEDDLTGVVLTQAQVLAQVVEGNLYAPGDVNNSTNLK